MAIRRRFWRIVSIDKQIQPSEERKDNEERIRDRVYGKTIVLDTVVFICAALVYSNTLNGDFVHDDIPAILRNRDVKGLTSMLKVFKNDFWGVDIKSNRSHKSYRPFCVLSFRLNYYIHEFRPAYFHLVNILLHGIVSVLVSMLTREVVYNRKIAAYKVRAFVSGLLFALHPIHTEAVANLVGRAEVLAAAFYISAILLHNRSLESNSRMQEFCWLMLCLLSSGSAMLMKETGVTVLGIIFALEAFRVYASVCTGRRWLAIRHVLKMILITAWTSGLLYFRFSIMGWHHPNFAPPDNPASKSPVTMTRCMTYCYIAWINIKLLLLPVYLSYDWSYGTIPLITSWFDFRNLATLLLLITFTYAILSTLRKSIDKLVLSTEALGLMLLIVPYIPCSNLLFPVGFVVAERTLYIPSIGFIILVVSLSQHSIYTNLKVRKLAKGILLVLVIFYSVKTIQRNEDWRSKKNLFLSGLKTFPHNAKVRYNWANYLRDTERYDEAVYEYEETLKLYPTYPGALNNLATILEKNESTMERAQELYVRLIHLVPLRAEAYMNLASLMVKREQYKNAAKVYVRLMSRRIIPLMNVVSLANKLIGRNLRDHAEILLVLLLREFCSAQNDVHVMKTLSQLVISGYNVNPYGNCLQDMPAFQNAMTMYARLLDLKGMFEEARVIRNFKPSLRNKASED